MPGQSGSPIIINDKIIGIHVGRGEKKIYNFGRLVTLGLLDNIKKWA
jgi:V8-like Glu-specific endopeptidase